MKGAINLTFPHAGLAMGSGILLTVGLLLFISALANYHAHTKPPRPLLVVELSAWPMPIKHEQQPKPKKQAIPRKPVVKKSPPPPKPTPFPQAKIIEKELPPEPLEHTAKEYLVDESKENIVPTLSEPTPPMLIEPSEKALPTPVPIFKLTQAPRFLHREDPVYPEAMRIQGISGSVKLEALIDKDGRVREVNILKTGGKHFDEAARNAILASSFYPAKVESEAVAVLLRLPVKFNLR